MNMADIELVVKIPEETYIHLCNGGNIGASLLIENAIKNGTPLPAHERLIDAERLLTVIHKNTVGDLFDQLIDMQPTIIEAETKSEE